MEKQGKFYEFSALFTSGWTESQPSISPPETKLGLYYKEKYVQYDFDTYNGLHVS